MVTGMMAGIIRNNTMNCCRMRNWVHSNAANGPHNVRICAKAGPNSDSIVEMSVAPRMLYKMPEGMMVKINGMKLTLNKTILFLNTSDHSLRTRIQIFFMAAPHPRSVANTHLPSFGAFLPRIGPGRLGRPVLAPIQGCALQGHPVSPPLYCQPFPRFGHKISGARLR